jgi:DNA-binding NtrC family response regulator
LAAHTNTGAEQQRDFPDAAKEFARRCVLVVDDERLVRWSVAEVLTARGFDVAEAADARSAMQEFGAGDTIDLVLLDLRLPDADDLRVLASIRQRAPHVPVIVMTAFATRELVEEAAALHAAVVNKPFELDDLMAEVERALTPRVY